MKEPKKLSHRERQELTIKRTWHEYKGVPKDQIEYRYHSVGDIEWTYVFQLIHGAKKFLFRTAYRDVDHIGGTEGANIQRDAQTHLDQQARAFGRVLREQVLDSYRAKI